MSEYNFLGTITNKIESQGRMKFPAKFRRGGDSAKNEPFVLVRGLDGCIRVYPEEEWVKIRQKLDKIDLSQQKLRDFKRCFLTDVSFHPALCRASAVEFCSATSYSQARSDSGCFSPSSL